MCINCWKYDRWNSRKIKLLIKLYKDANLTTYNKVDVKLIKYPNPKHPLTSISNPAYAFIVRKNSVNGYYEIQSDSVLTSDRTGVSSLSLIIIQMITYKATNLITLVITWGNDIVIKKINRQRSVKQR